MAGLLVAEYTYGSLIWKALVADVFMTCLIFGASIWQTNSSAYDAITDSVVIQKILDLIRAPPSSQPPPLKSATAIQS